MYIIRFERILKTRSENAEKLGKDLFNYDLPSESRKNTFTGLKTPQNCLFSSHLFIRQSWTKVLGHFRVSGAFSNSLRSNPSPHSTNNVGRVYLQFFSEFQLCIGWGKGKRQENFENDALFEDGTEKWQKNMNITVVSQGFLPRIVPESQTKIISRKSHILSLWLGNNI